MNIKDILFYIFI